MTYFRTADEQARFEQAEDEYQRIQMLEAIEPDGRPARLMDMSWPTAEISVERIKPAVPQPEFEPRRTVRSHEVPLGGKPSLADWIFFLGGVGIVAGWVLLILAVLLAWLAA